VILQAITALHQARRPLPSSRPPPRVSLCCT
jgi:hypothetical protein